MTGLEQYLDLLGRGAQAAQWGLYVGLGNLGLLVANLILLVVNHSRHSEEENR